MQQVRKSCFCQISAIFFQCCFMCETQVLMPYSNFSDLFSRNHFLECGFIFQWRVVIFQLGESFNFTLGAAQGRGHRFWWGQGLKKKKKWDGRGHHPAMWPTIFVYITAETLGRFHFSFPLIRNSDPFYSFQLTFIFVVKSTLD